MANSNQLIVEVIGDTSRLTRDLRSATNQINRFAATASTASGTRRSPWVESMLRDVERIKTGFAEVNPKLLAAASAEDEAAASTANLGTKALVAGIAVNILGRNLEKMGGNTAKAGKALTAITSLDLPGFGEALRDTEGKQKALTAELLKSGDASKAMSAANRASAIGMDALAAAAKGAASAIREQTNAFVDATKIRDSTSPGAIASETSGLPLPDPKKRKGITATQRNQFFDSALERSLDRAQDLRLQDQVVVLKGIAKTIQERIAVTKDITRKLTLEDELVKVTRQREGVEEQIARNAEARAKAAREAALKLKLQREARAKALEEARRIAIQSKQFKALGFAPDGGEFVPGIANLRQQLGSLTDRLAGSTVNLSSKLKSQLAGAREVLSGEFGKATVESRQRIKELFDTIRGEFDKGAKGPLTKTTGLNTKKIVEGLGLSPDEVRALRGRLSGFNSDGRAIAGGRTSTNGGFVGGRGQVVESHVTVQVDGQTLTKVVTRGQQKTKSRNPSQRRGPNRGK